MVVGFLGLSVGFGGVVSPLPFWCGLGVFPCCSLCLQVFDGLAALVGYRLLVFFFVLLVLLFF